MSAYEQVLKAFNNNALLVNDFVNRCIENADYKTMPNDIKNAIDRRNGKAFWTWILQLAK